ncbi:hypothetical protein E2C01_055940 [Portunus trituberculatus]|uniref:Uncharacterized protein n=1 Tax=Portunus trituberculatus TaxID=210409 RepID=A0A5B7GZ01_PORTR|nr:hypothetical protein [Portunus trituberculatus]
MLLRVARREDREGSLIQLRHIFPLTSLFRVHSGVHYARAVRVRLHRTPMYTTYTTYTGGRCISGDNKAQTRRRTRLSIRQPASGGAGRGGQRLQCSGAAWRALVRACVSASETRQRVAAGKGVECLAAEQKRASVRSRPGQGAN